MSAPNAKCLLVAAVANVPSPLNVNKHLATNALAGRPVNFSVAAQLLVVVPGLQ